MKKPFFILLLVLIILSATLVSAAPPFTETSGISSLHIIAPKYFFYPSNQSIKLNFDVLNSTYLKLDNSTTSCSFDMVNISGDNVASGVLTYDNVNEYWYYTFTSKPIGTYSYYVHCAGSTESGFISSQIVVTSTGEDNDSVARAIVMILMGLIPLIIAGILFWVYHALAEQQFPLKIFLLLLGFVFILIEYNVIYEIAYFFNITFIYTTMQHWLFSWCFYIILIYVGIMLLYNLFMGLNRFVHHKKEKDFEELRP